MLILILCGLSEIIDLHIHLIMIFVINHIIWPFALTYDPNYVGVWVSFAK